MADAIGVEGIHAVSGRCDLCGDTVDPNTQELNVLGCTFKQCETPPYHQDCLEKYLKSIRCERNRKTGFKCPRGTGKGTLHKDPCPGKIDKSHPIHPRNEEQKKKKKAKLPELLQAPVRGAAGRDKDKGAVKPKEVAAPKKPPPPAPVKALPPKPAPPPPDPKKKLQEAVAAARREIGVGGRPKEPVVAPPPPPVLAPAVPARQASNTLDAYLPNLVAGAAPSGVNAWGKPPAGARPAPPTLAPAAAAAGAARPAPAPAPALAHAHSNGLPEPSLAPAGLLGRAASVPALVAEPSSNKPAGPVGAEYVDDKEAGGMTRAQKKNLKRAEKKLLEKKRGDASDANSLAGSDAGDAAAPGTPAAPPEAVPPPPPAAAVAVLQEAAAPRATTPPPAAVGSTAAPRAAAVQLAAPTRDSVVSQAAPTKAPAPQHQQPVRAAPAAAAPSAAAPAASVSPAGPADPCGEVDVSLLEEVALQGLVAAKASKLVGALCRMGFPLWAAAAGVQRHGVRLVEAVAWLLEAGPSLTPAGAVAAAAPCTPEVSVAAEQAELAALVADAGGDAAAAYTAVLESGGDLLAAQQLLADRGLLHPTASSNGRGLVGSRPPAAGGLLSFTPNPAGAQPVLPILAPVVTQPGWLPAANGPEQAASRPAAAGLWQPSGPMSATPVSATPSLGAWLPTSSSSTTTAGQQSQWPLSAGMGGAAGTPEGTGSSWVFQQQQQQPQQQHLGEYQLQHGQAGSANGPAAAGFAAGAPFDPFTYSSTQAPGAGEGAGVQPGGAGDSDDTDLEGLMATLMQVPL